MNTRSRYRILKERPSDFRPEELRHVELLDALMRSARARQKAENALHRNIAKAHREGLSFRTIGRAVGLSHTRVLQIVHGRAAEHGTPPPKRRFGEDA